MRNCRQRSRYDLVVATASKRWRHWVARGQLLEAWIALTIYTLVWELTLVSVNYAWRNFGHGCKFVRNITPQVGLAPLLLIHLRLYSMLLAIVVSSGGVVVRALASHQCGPGSISRLGVRVCGLSLLVLCSERFFPGFSGFPLSSKTCIWLNLIWSARPHTLWGLKPILYK